jgi:hypothetical protein
MFKSNVFDSERRIFLLHSADRHSVLYSTLVRLKLEYASVFRNFTAFIYLSKFERIKNSCIMLYQIFNICD